MKSTLLIPLVLLTLSCDNTVIEENYKLDYDPNNEIFLLDNLTSGNTHAVKIPGHILFYGHSKDFIIAMQKNKDAFDYAGENLTLEARQKETFKSPYTSLWVLDIRRDRVFGPVDKPKYLKIREELGIPDDLKMDHSTFDFYPKGQRNDIQYQNPDPTVIDVKHLKGND